MCHRHSAQPRLDSWPTETESTLLLNFGKICYVVCKCARATLTKTTAGWFGTTEIYFLTVLEARSPNPRFQQVHFPLKTPGGSVADLSQLLAAAGTLWLVDGHFLTVSPHLISPWCISVPKFPFLKKGTGHWIRAHPNDHILHLSSHGICS